MSEYQYYEFQAVDRRLTQEQMAELRACSTRARITPTSFVNVYNWGDFKGDPHKWMEKYFDAFLYVANWGTRQLMLRLPTRLLDPDIVSMYWTDESLSYSAKGDQIILVFDSEEEYGEWAEGEGWLASLVPLRLDLMRGDHRCLYLGWLCAITEGMLAADDLEPPVPPGLATLNAPLQTLADFLRIDLDLIAAAAEKSEEEPAYGLSKEDIARWVTRLPSKEKDAVLIRLVVGDDPHIATELSQRALYEMRSKMDSCNGVPDTGRRSVGQLVARAEAITEERQRREAEQQAREKAEHERIRAENRKKYLESLIGSESGLWARVNKLIAVKQPKQYDEAVSLLKDLRDLADAQGKDSEFSQRMSALYREHSRKPSLIGRLQKANLPE